MDGLTRGDFCYVLTSRQMGKSSLMVRTAARLRESGSAVAVLDLTAVGQNLTPEQWYDGLLSLLARALDLEDELERFWLAHERLSPLQRWMDALRDVVLSQSPGNVVVFIDEIDAVRSIPFSADEFFAGIRECYNRRSEDPEYKRLTFCLLGVAAPSDLIRDTRTTPFNIGRRIDLTDFTLSESTPLAAGLTTGLPGYVNSQGLLHRILYWTGGHPYLTQRLCQAVANSLTLSSSVSAESVVDSVCRSVFLAPAARERDDNLLFVRERILRSESETAALLGTYAQIQKGSEIEDDEANPLITILKLSGIVRTSGKHLRVRNPIYERVFDSSWVRENLPDAEIRRQRTAYWRGVLRTAAIFSLILCAMASLAAYAVIQRNRAESRLRASLLTEARALRMSGEPGQYFSSLSLLQRAARIRRGRDLTNEAIAALASPVDLRSIRTWNRLLPGENLCGWDFENQQQYYTDQEGNIRIRDARTAKTTRALPGVGHEGEIISLTRDGRYGVITYTDKLVYAWNIQTATKLWSGVNGKRLADFDPGGAHLAAFEKDGAVSLRSLNGDKSLKRIPFRKHLDQRVVRFNPLGNRLAVAVDRSLTIIDLNGAKTARWNAASGINEIAWNPDGSIIACGEESGIISLWNARSGALIRSLYGHTDAVISLTFSHRGDILATSSWDESLRLWDPRIGQQLLAYPWTAITLDFSEDDRELLGGGSYYSRLFEVGGGQVCRRFCSYSNRSSLWSSEFSPDGSLLLLGDDNGVEIWETASQREAGRIDHLGRTRTIAISRNGKTMLTVSNSSARIWPLLWEKGRRMVIGPSRRLPIPEGPGALFGALQRDGELAAVRHISPGTSVGRAYIFDAESGREVGRTKELVAIAQLAVSPEGRWLAYGSGRARGIRVWDRQEKRVVFNPLLNARAAVAFSPDGKWLVTRELPRFRFWRAGTWSPGSAFPRLEGGERFGGVSFPDDCRWAALSKSTSQIVLVDPDSGSGLVHLESAIGLGDNVKTDQAGSRIVVMKRTQHVGEPVHFAEVWDLEKLHEQLSALGLAPESEVFPFQKARRPASAALTILHKPSPGADSEPQGVQPSWAGN